MREILFKGKRKDTGEWVEGYYGQFHNRPYSGEKNSHQIFEPREDARFLGSAIGGLWHVVDPATVGQYTGLTDKNGKKIFEGDIVRARDDVFGSPFCNGIVGKVTYEEAAFFIETPNVIDSQYLFNECAVYEIIGNIHDNPELMKGGAE